MGLVIQMFNITRPQEIPPSLSLDTPKYNTDDVLKSLNEMSYSKCYICESRYPEALAVEHFDANGDRHDWNNLLLACHRCNSNLKGARYNELLNPCDQAVDVVRLIRHDVPKGPNSPIRIEKVIDHQGVDLTVELLDNVFNLDDTGNRSLTRGFLRKKIFAIVCKFYAQIWVFIDDDSTPSVKQSAREQIEHYLRCEQEYSAFLRWIVLDDGHLRGEFEQCIL